jgi:hypothetical protein
MAGDRRLESGAFGSGAPPKPKASPLSNSYPKSVFFINLDGLSRMLILPLPPEAIPRKASSLAKS